ncbi:uncharacterized protein LOC108094357 [Drosophila ficusphila]|uniref:uncharacterized protein LOC108094357 n=1 Tax=Drosophila ficusphila TaxID=30025 RepID=UPI0007E860D8|nr:uncharacterized protein LOC108094357 [Drosophila ficusphila]
MFDTTKYFPRYVDSEHPSQLEPEEPPPSYIPVTYDMVHNLDCSLQDDPLVQEASVQKASVQEASESEPNTKTSERNFPLTPQTLEAAHAATPPSTPQTSVFPQSTPQLMIIFEEGDINSALHFLLESAHYPFSSNAVAMVLVEERIREDIVKRILPKLHPLSESVAEHPNFLQALEKLEDSSLEVIKADVTEVAPPLASPIFVCECPLEELGEFPTGVITFHTFRNNQEAIDICQRETLSFSSVSIWNESLEGCYELVVALSSPSYFFNCTNVDLIPISKQLKGERNCVIIENGFHFETLHIYEQFKSIVFPIGELILPTSEDPKEEPAPISFLDP